MTTRDFRDDDLAAIAADEVFVDLIASGGSTDDELAQVLAQWRSELAAAEAGLPTSGPERRRAPVRWLHRHTAAAAAAALVVVAASTGAAAAAGGPRGPLGEINRVLFGTGLDSATEATTLTVTAMLDGVAAQIRAARQAGGVTNAQRADLGDRLDAADRLVAADPGVASGLTDRISRLRATLAALDTVPADPPDVGIGDRVARPGDTDERHGPGGGAAGDNDGDADDHGATDGDTSGGGGDGATSGGPTGSSGSGSSGGTSGDGGSGSSSSSSSGPG